MDFKKFLTIIFSQNSLKFVTKSYPSPAERVIRKTWSETILEVNVGQDDQGHDKATHHRSHDGLDQSAAHNLDDDEVPTLK